MESKTENTNEVDSNTKKGYKKWLTTNVLLLGLVSFFADLSGEMMTPVLPLFIVSLGGTSVIVVLRG